MEERILRRLSSLSLARLRATKMIQEDELSGFVRDSVCRFQLNFSQFAFKASLIHKRFKENPNDETFEELVDFFARKTKSCVTKLVEDIETYFEISHRNKVLPRIGVMSIVDKKDDLMVVAQIPVKEKNSNKNIKDYTCFIYIEDTGKPYLCNNLPLAIKTEGFKHAGIDLEKAASYKPRFSRFYGTNGIEKFCSRLRPQREADNAWKEIFKATDTNQHTFYKSHLIVPITFKRWNHRDAIDDDFRRFILSDEGRSILGCIAIDHQNTFYFDDRNADSSGRYGNIDANIVYIFADLISLYFTVQRTYTVGSRTYNDFSQTK